MYRQHWRAYCRPDYILGCSYGGRSESLLRSDSVRWSLDPSRCACSWTAVLQAANRHFYAVHTDFCSWWHRDICSNDRALDQALLPICLNQTRLYPPCAHQATHLLPLAWCILETRAHAVLSAHRPFRSHRAAFYTLFWAAAVPQLYQSLDRLWRFAVPSGLLLHLIAPLLCHWIASVAIRSQLAQLSRFDPANPHSPPWVNDWFCSRQTALYYRRAWWL